MSLTLSIDVGTTNIKAALVDDAAVLCGSASSVAMGIEGDASGRAEHDPHKLLAALIDVCRQAIGERGDEVDLLALTSYHFGLVLVDRDGEPLTRVSTFVDTTAQAHHPHFLEAVGDVEGLYRRTGCPPIFQYPAVRLHHIRTTRPEIAGRTAHVLDSKAFLMHRLTGEYVTDYSTANSTGCLDVNGGWDRTVIEATGFLPEQFPRVLNGFVDRIPLLPSVCRELGLRNGTEISAGLYDGAALAAAMSGFEPGIAVGNFGTSGMLRVPVDEPIEDYEGGLIQNCLLRPGRFFTGSGINNCTIATNMLLAILGLDLGYLRDRELSVPGANGIMTFPYFTGERDTEVGNIGTGMVFGLGVASTRDDLARSFLEGVAFSYLLVKSRLDPDGEIAQFRLGGGGTANLAWMQIMADVLNLPIHLTQNPEMGIIGAAILTRCGEGGELLDASHKIMQGARIVEPIEKNVPIYAEIADRYFSVRDSLREPLLARRGLGPMRSAKTKAVRRELPLV